MKHGLLASALFLTAYSGWGAIMEIGYCNGEVSTQTLSKVGNCDVSAAVILSPEILKHYEGADITGIRLYLATTDNLVDLTAWVRDELSGENLAQGTGVLEKGWQNITLDKTLKVGNSPVVVGYTFNQTKSSKCIALGGDVVKDGHYIAKKGAWETSSAPEGSICVELIVEGNQVAESDLQVVSVSNENPVVKNGEEFKLTATVRNSSLSTINGFDYALDCPIINHSLVEGKYEGILQPKHTANVEITVSSSQFPLNEPIPLDFHVYDAGYEDNNEVEVICGSYDEAYPRLLLMEEFTTEECPNCPRAINSIATAFEKGYGDNMVVIAHHVGFYTDWLTIPEEKELLWLYGDDGSFAPAGMYDRTIRTSDLKTPVESIGFIDTFLPRLDEAIGKPGFVKLALSASVTSEGVNVSVDAEAHPLLKALLDSPRITVLLTESGLKHLHQAGISNPEFTHSHASRAYFTEIFGDPIEFDADGKLHWTATLPVKEDWNLNNMEAVAFINAYNPEDRTQCQVYNVAATHLSTAGVGNVNTSQSVTTEFYDMQGHRVLKPSKGLYIKKEVSEDGTVTVTKQIK